MSSLGVTGFVGGVPLVTANYQLLAQMALQFDLEKHGEGAQINSHSPQSHGMESFAFSSLKCVMKPE